MSIEEYLEGECEKFMDENTIMSKPGDASGPLYTFGHDHVEMMSMARSANIINSLAMNIESAKPVKYKTNRKLCLSHWTKDPYRHYFNPETANDFNPLNIEVMR